MKNLLQKHAHLFANGKFKVEVGREAKFITTFQPYVNETDGNYYHNGFRMKHCTLIARPIEDMTVKEVNQINEDQFYGTTYQQVIRELKTVNINMRTDHALYLLSISVYPFDQSHFEDETVIDSREIQ